MYRSDLMFGGPQQPAFASALVKLGLVKYKDLNGGTPNCVSFTPNVSLIVTRRNHERLGVETN